MAPKAINQLIWTLRAAKLNFIPCVNNAAITTIVSIDRRLPFIIEAETANWWLGFSWPEPDVRVVADKVERLISYEKKGIASGFLRISKTFKGWYFMPTRPLLIDLYSHKKPVFVPNTKGKLNNGLFYAVEAKDPFIIWGDEYFDLLLKHLTLLLDANGDEYITVIDEHVDILSNKEIRQWYKETLQQPDIPYKNIIKLSPAETEAKANTNTDTDPQLPMPKQLTIRF